MNTPHTHEHARILSWTHAERQQLAAAEYHATRPRILAAIKAGRTTQARRLVRNASRYLAEMDAR